MEGGYSDGVNDGEVRGCDAVGRVAGWGQHCQTALFPTRSRQRRGTAADKHPNAIRRRLTRPDRAHSTRQQEILSRRRMHHCEVASAGDDSSYGYNNS